VIVPADLLAGLQRLLKRLEPDIRSRCETDREIDARLRVEYEKARSASRTAQVYEVWREDYITQVAVAWILGCVFVRFLEDNRLIDIVWLAGPNARLQLARDQHTLYFQANPTHSDREYLEHVFAEVAKLPSMRDLLDGSHNPISKLGPSGDGAHELLEFWQKVNPSTGALSHDFSDPEWNTRFLGDLYQDLSESARKRYALLQTPEFVEEFILDRTLKPAIEEFGYAQVKLIDPTCGSGHFLLGGFHRLFQTWARHEPGMNLRELAQRALDGVFGVDLNPNVVAIARFRLLIAALKVCGVRRLEAAPGFRIHLAAGDSLLHGPRLGSELERADYLENMDPFQHVYETEDAEVLRHILGQQYNAVVGNPPYITVGDAALDGEYRRRYGSCYRQYSLAVPFMERFFHLAVKDTGYVGMITANSFMKREFGKKLVQEYVPRWDLTHVIDTAGAYIPGHGTPTVILFGRAGKPVGRTIRTVMGIRGEPQTPDDPAHGLVWEAILRQIDHVGSESSFVSVGDLPRNTFGTHPWSIGGGGAAELKQRIESAAVLHLCDYESALGRGMHTGLDEAYFASVGTWHRYRIPAQYIVQVAEGTVLRDWSIRVQTEAIFPYDEDCKVILQQHTSPVLRQLWPSESHLVRRREPNGTHLEIGLTWYEWSRFHPDRFRLPVCIAFAFVATHNQFSLHRGSYVFNRSAPVIRLIAQAGGDEPFALIGLLNSSTACFWIKQVSHNKGSTVDQHGARQRTAAFEDFFEHDGTKLKQFPVPATSPVSLAKTLDSLALEQTTTLPAALVRRQTPTGSLLREARTHSTELLQKMIAMQEELDWQCYNTYGLTDEDFTMGNEAPPPICLGERAFEIVMARKMRDGELETTWFVRHRSTPITELPAHWPAEYRALVERRIDVIKSDRYIALIEQPEYKRRWNVEPWDEQENRALRAWLLQRMEDARYWFQIELTTCAKLADCITKDVEIRQIAELYRGRSDFDFTALVVELIEPESIPLLPVLHFSDSGLRKRVVWDRTWDLQRREDAVDADVQADRRIPDLLKDEVARKRKADEVGEIPAPPKYDAKDFQKQSYWSLRGKLDVPKERFLTFPSCERDVDPTPVIAWAGWDHLQQAQAIAAYYERVKNHEGWSPDRRVPLLTGILELLPWLKQWHNDINPEYHERMGDFFEQFVEEEARAMEMTLEEICAWKPPVQTRERRRRRGDS
jgi:hypothetical protein